MNSVNNSKIYNISSLKKQILTNFYKKNFKNKFNFINNNWRWLYRENFKKNVSSISIFLNKKMIGLSGSMPFEFVIEKKKYISSWFIDFIIDDKFQGFGFGTKLAKNWEKRISIGFTFCNKKSLKIFKKNNWIVKNMYNIFFIPLNPFNFFKFKRFIPIFFRSYLNNFFFYIFKKLNFKEKKNIVFLYPTKINFESFFNKKNNNFSPARNNAYFNWRIFKSPYYKNYRLVCFDDKKNPLLIKLNNSKGKKFIEVLFYFDNENNKYLRNLLLNLADWGFKRNYTYIKMLLDIDKIKKLKFFLIVQKKLNFAFFARNLSIKKKLKKNLLQFHLIDSDFEFLSNTR